CGGPGICNMMGTANTMCCLVEVLGLTLPGGGTLPALGAARRQLAFEAGRRVMTLLHQGLTARHFLTGASLTNAVRVPLAFGGSTWTVPRLAARAWVSCWTSSAPRPRRRTTPRRR